METDDQQFVAALARLRESAVRHGIAPGLHVGTAEQARRRVAEGWKFVAISSELGFMLDAAARCSEEAGAGGTAGGTARY